jgi:hypothetical protein
LFFFREDATAHPKGRLASVAEPYLYNAPNLLRR